MANGLSPEESGKPSGDEHRSGMLKKCSIQSFGDPILLGGVVDGDGTFRSLLLQMTVKTFVNEFSTPIAVKFLDRHSELSLYHRLIIFICLKCHVFPF